MLCTVDCISVVSHILCAIWKIPDACLHFFHVCRGVVECDIVFTWWTNLRSFNLWSSICSCLLGRVVVISKLARLAMSHTCHFVRGLVLANYLSEAISLLCWCCICIFLEPCLRAALFLRCPSPWSHAWTCSRKHQSLAFSKEGFVSLRAAVQVQL